MVDPGCSEGVGRGTAYEMTSSLSPLGSQGTLDGDDCPVLPPFIRPSKAVSLKTEKPAPSRRLEVRGSGKACRELRVLNWGQAWVRQPGSLVPSPAHATARKIKLPRALLQNLPNLREVERLA